MKKQMPIHAPYKQKPTLEEQVQELRNELTLQVKEFENFVLSTKMTLDAHKGEIVRLRNIIQQEKREKFLRRQSAKKRFESE